MKSGNPKATGLTEGLFGSVGSGQKSDNTSTSSNIDQVTALDFDAGPGAVMASAVESQSSPVASALPAGARGELRSPDELGVIDKQAGEDQKRRTVRIQARPTERRSTIVNNSRRRSNRVIKSTLTPAATAAAAASIASISSRIPNDAAEEATNEPSKVCSIAYRGMEVIFCTSQQSSKTTVLGLCARTRVAFQTLHLPKRNASTTVNTKVVSIVGHPGTGLVAIAMSDGTVQTYKPVKASQAPTSSSDEPVSAFGRYRWVNGNVIRCREVFYGKDGDEGYEDVFDDKCLCESLEKTVDISSSVDLKVLVAHKDQLAVFDATPPDYLMMPDGISPTNRSPSMPVMGQPEAPDAELLWTTRLQANIVTAKLSGDGRAIVLALEGDGEGTPSPYGARTFIRDLDDGSLINATTAPGKLERIDLSRASSVGILYKPGPFLVHSTHISRLSFRGYGHVTSNIRSDEDEGNDLLLTFCKGDCSVRIFSQNSWKQLMHWTTPADSRADWVSGITAFNLGDLEAPKKKKTSGFSTPNSPNSRRPSATSTSSGGSAGINKKLLRDRPFNTVAAHSTAPTSAAGAWIAELTFRNAFPALRLSRLSYMKRGGDDAQPAHFESVAAILPAGSLIAESILNSEEMGLSVQGIWPAWNPWHTGPAGSEAGGSLSGSAMALLGLPSGPASTGGLFGESHSGGTHSPPSELRLVASHPLTGKVVIMEFPFWGDQDFGAMELGSPIRYLLSLCEDYSGNHQLGCSPKLEEKMRCTDTQNNPGECAATDAADRVPSFVCLDHESNRLCARIDKEGKSISLSWRKQANMSVRPVSRSLRTGFIVDSDDYSIASTASVDSNDSQHSFETHDTISGDNHNLYKDISLIPAPIALPALHLPRSTNGTHIKDEIVAIQWWKDENFGGPPQLLAVTSSGTMMLYEMPPPWCALEPTMPSYDPFELSTAGSVNGSLNGEACDSGSDDDSLGPLRDYDVMVTPHPDFGIGLRLESQADGMPAIAGSFKKHPLSGGRLPAERTGMIVLGDELLSVNDETLEGLSFDNIIATVRDVGLQARPGEALCMKFRPDSKSRQIHSGSAFSGSDSGRRTKEQILGMPPKAPTGNKSSQVENMVDDNSTDSQTSMQIGAEGEMQQEFCRIIAIVRHAIPEVAISGQEAQSKFLLLPFNGRPSSSHPQELRGAALVITVDNSSIRVRKFDVAADNDAEKARCTVLGELDLFEKDNKEGKEFRTIKNIAVVEAEVADWCLSILDSGGGISLVFIKVEVDIKAIENPHVSFRYHEIARTGYGSQALTKCLMRAASIDLIGTMSQTADGCKRVQVWSCCPDPSSENGTSGTEMEYLMSTVALSPSLSDPRSEEKEIVDFRFVASGRLDAFPWLVTFTKKSATVYRREASQLLWKPIAELLLKPLENSMLSSDSCSTDFDVPVFFEPNISPADLFPHLVPTLRNIVSATDEQNYLRSDWHPDSILAYVCTEKDGAYKALRRSIRGIFIWLARWMNEDIAARPLLDLNFPLGTTPFRALDCDEATEDDGAVQEESAASLMASLSFARRNEVKPKSEEEILLDKLRTALCPSNNKVKGDKAKIEANKIGKSKEFLLAMKNAGEGEKEDDSGLPPPLKKLNRDEIRLLWAMGELLAQPPKSKNLDQQAQLSLFSICLYRKIMEAENDDEKEEICPQKGPPTVPTSVGGRPLLIKRHSYLVKKKSSLALEEPSIPPAVSSAGCLSALASNCQTELLERSRIPNEKLDWETAKKLRLPFWIRSDDVLRRTSEEIGQRTYKDKRDIMESAIFFIAARNIRTMRNLAATDRSASGSKFLKFITSYDFKSDRGRKAAEKNAYSLLRKRRYIVASAFFLMAEPPMLKTALEVIVTQMQDLDLAFLVSRLMDSKDQPPSEALSSSSIVGGFGGGFGLGGVLGGGGGFAASATVSEPQVQHDEEKFDDWKPNLSQGSKSLLNERGLELARDDHCMQAIQLLWMGQVEEATCCLSGAPARKGGNHKIDVVVPQCFDLPAKPGPRNSANERVILKANTLINFCSSPFLLKALKYSTRSRWASSLLVARALSRRGMDIPSIRILLHQIDVSEVNQGDDSDLSESSANKRTSEQSKGANVKSNSTGPASTIFDAYDAEITAKPKKEQPRMNDQKASSIFDDFDHSSNATYKGNNKVRISPQQENTSSSIFDAFDAPARPSNVASTRKPIEETSSSIFDSYALPHDVSSTKMPADPTTTPQSGEMSSSIFDSFETPQKPVVKNVPNPVQPSQAKQMSSSIFDSFDPPGHASQQKSQSQTGAMGSSIFDSFDVPSKSVGTGQNVTQPPSIFDSFDVPNSRMKTKAADNTISSETALSIESKEENEIVTPARKTPDLWLDLRSKFLQVSAARRILREVARLVDRFHGDALDPPMVLFRRHIHPLVPLSATEILRSHCDGQALLGSVKRALTELCNHCNIDENAVIDQALSILACKTEPRRIVFAVIFYSVLDRADLVEDAIREASQKQIQQCESFAFSNDDLVHSRKTVHHVSSQYLRRQAARLSWQLELCLWLHRGGAYPLCAIASKEAIVAVRIGLIVAGWGRNHECAEKMIKCEPDCRMDEEAGRQIWSSMKMISSSVESGTSGLTSSGGWEFLVDCRREEATEMLRNRPTGAFILRPHAEDHGVFTLSFKTNLIPSTHVNQENAKSSNTTEGNDAVDDEALKNEAKSDPGGLPPKPTGTRPVKKDEVVQHAILRLSDAGFRCGSFGPFTSLMKLLEAVSASLPFDLLFNAPPTESVIKDQGAQPSPNSLFLRKIALCSQSENYRWNRTTLDSSRNIKTSDQGHGVPGISDCDEDQHAIGKKDAKGKENYATRKRFGMFTQLLALSEVRKQLSSVSSAQYEDIAVNESSWQGDANNRSHANISENIREDDSIGSFSNSAAELGVEELYAISARILRPFLCWCRMIETGIVFELAPPLSRVTQAAAAQPVAMVVSETEIEVAPNDVGSRIDGGDAVIRQLIQPDSGVEFRTVRVGEGGDSAMIVLFNQSEAIAWFLSTGIETDRQDALARLQLMEKGRVIERVDLNELSAAHDVRYRFVDPWEVEALESKEGETMAASLGREHFFEFSVARVAQACDNIQRSLGGLHLMALWSAAKGGIFLTKAFATVHAPWERDAGGDLQMTRGHAAEPPQYSNSIRQHLYRNALFRRLKVPQRYLALVQVELLDLKNLTSPGGSVALSVYALLRLKRPGSGAPLTHKARTLDSACTEPKRVGKTSGPNAPASWGTLVRFRFPLPEDVNCDGISYDGDREVLFKGAPSVLQLSVYEKKFMNDISLGEADVKLDALTSGSQLEEWVPLKAGKHGITWFARIRLTLRFELMCLPSDNDDLDDVPPSVGLRKIHQLSQLGGAHEDTFAKSSSTPDLLSYFESMVY